MSVSVQEIDFDAGKEINALYADEHEVGAVTSFVGVVRARHENLLVGAGETTTKSETTMQQGGRTQDALCAVACGDAPSAWLHSLTLEHYPGMTEGALEAIVAQANARWSLRKVRVIHRVGTLQIGEQIVFVGVAAAHRGEAFAACEFIMDYLKTRAPFWKKEESEAGGRWVDARELDDAAAARWS